MPVSLLLFLLLSASHDVQTVAGSGQEFMQPSETEALRANVGQPYGVEVGPDGALYVCEISNHVVRRVDLKSGAISIVAGNGKKGYSGDGGPAAEAQLNEPYEVRFDAAGDMYFVEMKNAIVRKVDMQTGVISTVAGTGEVGFSGDGGPATAAKFNRPHSIALDSNNQLYICDIGNHRIRKVDLKSNVVSTFGGTGERKPTPDGAAVAGTPLNGPRALDFDGRGHLFLALREGNAIYRIDLKTQTLHHIAGTGKSGFTGNGGPALTATLSGPKGVAIAANGDVYFADTESHTIRVVRANGVMDVVIGDGKRGDGPDGTRLKCRLARPHGICISDDQVLFVGDSENHRVRQLPLR